MHYTIPRVRRFLAWDTGDGVKLDRLARLRTPEHVSKLYWEGRAHRSR